MSRKWLSGFLADSHGFDTALSRRTTHARVFVAVIPLRRIPGNRPASIPGSGTARQRQSSLTAPCHTGLKHSPARDTRVAL